MLTAVPLQLLALGLASLASTPAPWVLPPEAASTMRTAVTDTTDGLTLSASVEKDTVILSAQQDGETCEVKLVHPTASPDRGTLVEAFNVRVIGAPCPWRADFVESIVKRLEGQNVSLPWRAMSAKRTHLTAQQADQFNAALNQISYQIAAEDFDQALAGLDALTAKLPARMTLKRARLYQKMQKVEVANRLLDGLTELTPPLAAVKSLLLGGDPVTSVARLHEAPKASACDYTDLAEVLAALGHFEPAREVADWVLQHASGCEAAWESALQRRLETRDFDAAMALVPGALEAFGESPGVLGLVASAYHAAEEHKKATVILQRLARLDPKDEGTIRVLLSAMLRDTERRAEYKAELSAERSDRPDDVLTQFLLGVIHHYENEFQASNALLSPLEETMGHQSRWNIYRAMNEFNLGRRDAALELLGQAADKPLPDPDIFYCRAEILRDTDRQQAYLDLKRYMASDKEGYMANADKETRVERMMRDLTACLKDGRPTCESEWEHPRLRFHTDPTTAGSINAPEKEGWPPGWPPWAFPVLTALGLGTLVLLTRRRSPS